MKVFDAASIRNVALVGHSGAGKTQLASALLFDAGAVNRFGKVDEGTTVTDYDDEAIARKHTLSAVPRLLRMEQAQDQPDRHARHGQLPERHASGAARRGSRGRRRRRRRRRAGLDRKSLGGGRRAASCRGSSSATGSIASAPASSARSSRCGTTLGRNCIPVQLPIGEERAFSGVVDLVAMKAYTFAPDESGKMTEGPCPTRCQAAATAARDALIEMVAEADDA